MKKSKLIPTLSLDVPRYDCPKSKLGLKKIAMKLEVYPVCRARKDYVIRNWSICKNCKIKPSTRKKKEEKKYKKIKPGVKNLIGESIYESRQA